METMTCAALVLVVEDDDDVRESLRDVIVDHGYKVVPAANGAEALALLRSSTRPCLILLDLVMPVMDGWQFLDHVRADAAIADIPVVVASAHAGSHAPPGIQGLLPKPIAIDHLLDTVERHCGQAA